jgi:tetratricopeptide (TPR) repeat protein
VPAWQHPGTEHDRTAISGTLSVHNHGAVEIGFAGSVAIYQQPARLPRRSTYGRQVLRIAPPQLLEREAELAELAAFCLDADRSAYAWWQGDAWSGKSALLSTFVLQPPPHVRVVSFFIPARLAAQDSREAFMEILGEQLAELVGEEVPASLSEASREGYLLDLLARGAAACRAADERLVLVVDGLDEDQSITTGPHAHSIAGLLPATPPAGMRIVVAGRPNPPVPDDVPGWHPLRDPAIIQPLSASRQASDIQRLSRQELQRLLGGSRAEQDLLGLLAAARGGLSGSDLEELTGIPLWEIEEVLHTVAGRTFSRRVSRQQPATDVYLLGHEEIQAAAARYLGSRLPSYRDRLHGWADAYRARGWPAGTPEYLLSGYYRLLTQLEDLPRAIACAEDTARHDRMLDVTGGDVAALAEVRAALGLIAAQDQPDLGSALALACHRDQLTDRNEFMPADLPSVWARLGQFARAEGLAASVPEPSRKASAQQRVARALATVGQFQQAEAIAWAISEPRWKTQTLGQVAAALAAAGQDEHAERLARAIDDPSRRARALAEVAYALATSGHRERAGTIAADAVIASRAIADPRAQENALMYCAQALAAAGHPQQAQALAQTASLSLNRHPAQLSVVKAFADAGRYQQATKAAHAIAEDHHRAQALSQVAEAIATAGRLQEARRAVRTAEKTASAVADQYKRGEAQLQVVELHIQTWQVEQAEKLARAINNGHWKATALTRVAETVAALGRPQLAEALARECADTSRPAAALARVAGALSKAGQQAQADVMAEHAKTLALSISGSGWEVTLALPRVVEALARAGQQAQAITVAEHTMTLGRAIVEEHGRNLSQMTTVEALAKGGQYQAAETAALSIPDVSKRAEALTSVAAEMTAAGQQQHASAIAGRAEALARSISNYYRWADPLARLAEALAADGQFQQAETVARIVNSADRRAQALVQIAEALIATGQFPHAIELLTEAEAGARSVDDRYGHRAHDFERVAKALALVGQHDRAETVARAISDSSLIQRIHKRQALGWVAEALAAAGESQRAEALARTIDGQDSLGRVLAAEVEVLARAERYQQAQELALTITDASWRTTAVTQFAEILAATGQHQSAIAALELAEAEALPILDSFLRSRALEHVARAYGAMGDHERARTVASAIDDYHRPKALAQVARTLAANDHLHEAAIAAEYAEVAARSGSDWGNAKAEALTQVAEAFAEAKLHQRAVAVAQSIASYDARSRTLAQVADVLNAAGLHQQAAAAARHAETAARAVRDPREQAQALMLCAEALARAGDVRAARRLATEVCTVARWTIVAQPILLREESVFAALTRALGH